MCVYRQVSYSPYVLEKLVETTVWSLLLFKMSTYEGIFFLHLYDFCSNHKLFTDIPKQLFLSHPPLPLPRLERLNKYILRKNVFSFMTLFIKSISPFAWWFKEESAGEKYEFHSGASWSSETQFCVIYPKQRLAHNPLLSSWHLNFVLVYV
jgi:hypothetical protein